MKTRKTVALKCFSDSTWLYDSWCFLSAEDKADLIDLARDGSSAYRLGRRANALLLLDEGWSCEQVAKALFLDDDTIRGWYRLYQKDGILGLARHRPPSLSCLITVERQETLIFLI